MKRLLASVVVLAGLHSFPAQAQQYVCMESTLGNFCMQLLHDKAPQTVRNFLNYVRDGDYDNTIVHRSERYANGQKFVIQSGGYKLTPEGVVSTIPEDPPIPNEAGVSNRRGTVAMATLAGSPHSATSQWFVNLGDNSGHLDYQNGGYTVFAEIVSGMEVVDAIADLQRINLRSTLGNAFTEVPVMPSFGAWVQTNDLVLIRRAYALDKLPSPFHCRIDSPQDAVTELCDNYFTLPVRIGDEYYSAQLQRDFDGVGLSAIVVRDSLRLLDTVPEHAAYYDAATRTLQIPSARVGDRVLRNIIWQLDDHGALRFSLQSFTPP